MRILGCMKELILGIYSLCIGCSSKYRPTEPKNIFVLRNNDIGDLITTTPLFEGLKKSFPQSKIIAGIGTWNKAILENNPYVDTVLSIDAPWHNKQCTPYPHNTIKGLLNSIRYIRSSEQVQALKSLNIDVGIDVLGSPQGSLLMMQSHIPYRLGVKGYAGGYSACQSYLKFDPQMHVGDFALKFITLLNGTYIPSHQPQIYLTQEELQLSKNRWQLFHKTHNTRIVISTGGGFEEKCWPKAYFKDLITLIQKNIGATVVLVGSKEDQAHAKYIQKHIPSVIDTCGLYTLRDTFALVSQANYVICNSSMLMHTSAAFNKKTLVLLGSAFNNAHSHAKLWSYPQTHIVLGKEKEGDTLPKPENAWDIFKKMIADDHHIIFSE